jgi:fatty-acyl-CoA synthase
MDPPQTSYWPPEASVPVRESTVGMVLREAAERFASATALVEGVPVPPAQRRRWTFEQLLADAERVAGGLLERFEPGERVAVWAPNIPEWVLLEFGAALAGLVLVTVNPAFKARELAYVLRQSGAAGIFLLPEFRGNPMAAILDEVRPGLDELREAVLFSEWGAFVASSASPPPFPDVRPGDAAQIQYTSGTTGFPKGAVLHHRGLTNNARIFAGIAGLDTADVCVSPMPMFHTVGCVLTTLGTLQSGARHVPVRAFDPALVLELIETERATVALGAPTMLIALLECPELTTRDLSSLRVVLSGGAPVPPDLVRRIQDTLNVRFSIQYGTTECSPLVSQVRLDDSVTDKTQTVGRPVPQTEVKIADPATGQPVPCGAIGEICVRGYSVMTGYHQMPEQTTAAIDVDGWYHTGDLASMDNRGFLRVQGRLKDMIIRGGENIYPREIEELLLEHPKVAEAAVVGMPDPTWGEAVAAFVRCTPGESTTPEELRAFCRSRLAGYKTPRHWQFVDTFPLTASGKIQKFVLRDRLSSQDDREDGRAHTLSAADPVPNDLSRVLQANHQHETAH